MASLTRHKNKSWRISPPPPDGFRLDLAGISPVLAHSPVVNRLLYNRGIRTRQAARKFLDPGGLQHLSDPFDLPDMERAARLIVSVACSGGPVGVFGDFDVDGLSGTAIVVRAIEDLGGTALPYIPNRESDGHGLSLQAVEAFAASGVRLIVTVDTGSTAVAEVAAANDAGIQTVITDHHLLDGVRPEAAALVNPQAGAEEMTPLAGAGVAYKLAQALYSIAGGDCPYDLLALAALGTIADSAPLIGENRLIVRLGLEELGRTRHPGLSALLDVSRPGQSSGRPDAELVSFYISPRLNAPGRLGDAEPSLRILTTSSHEEARVLAARLEAANNERRKLGEQLWRDVEKQLERQRGASMVTVRCDGYPAGMLGPLAGKLSEQYRLPAVAYSVTGGVARASMRSVPGFDVHAALSPVSETLTRFGGHAAAAGFMVDEGYVDAVLAELERQASWSLMGMDTEPVLEVDSETPLGDMGASLWDFVGAMEPFGQSNSKPVFVSRGVVPTEVKTIGAGGRHLRMKLEHEGRRVNAIGFGLGQAALGNGRVDVAYELRTDTWNGRIRKELGLLDIRSAQRA